MRKNALSDLELACAAEITRRATNATLPRKRDGSRSDDAVDNARDSVSSIFASACSGEELALYAGNAPYTAAPVKVVVARTPAATPTRTKRAKVVLPPVVAPVVAADEPYEDDASLPPFKRAFNLASDGNRQCAGYTVNALIRSGMDIEAAIPTAVKLANERV